MVDGWAKVLVVRRRVTERKAQQAISLKQYFRRLRRSYPAVIGMSLDKDVVIDVNAVGVHTESLV